MVRFKKNYHEMLESRQRDSAQGYNKQLFAF